MNATTAIIKGNLTKDPELYTFQNGGTLTKLTIAANRRTKNRDGEWETTLEGYYNIQVWGTLGEKAYEQLSKGNQIIAICTLKQQTWEDKEGNTRQNHTFDANEIGITLWNRKTHTKQADQPANQPQPLELTEDTPF